MSSISLVRLNEGQRQTVGQLTVDGLVLSTLELPNLHNQRNVSSIPVGTYPYRVEWSEKNGRVLRLSNVPNRSDIEVHIGNFNRDIQGCIIVGKYFADIDGDGYLDVKYSIDAMGELLDKITPSGFLTIKKKMI